MFVTGGHAARESPARPLAARKPCWRSSVPRDSAGAWYARGMLLLSDVLFALTAALHGWFLVLEMFLWQKPLGLKVFGQSREQAATTAVLAQNQGLYNGFLAAGIAWGLAEGHSSLG